MKLIHLIQKHQPNLLIKLLNEQTSVFISFILAALSLLAIWIDGPYLKWGDTYPLISIEKRFYLSMFTLLIFALIFSVFGVKKKNFENVKPSPYKKRLKDLEKRFISAVKFLKQNTINKQGTKLPLSLLPWHLLIGAHQSGKTSLLAHADIPYVLQKQFQGKNLTELDASDECDFWVTRDACIIDVPGVYIAPHENMKNGASYHPSFWRTLMGLIRSNIKPKQLRSIMIAIPLPSILNNGGYAAYQINLQYLIQRLQELSSLFNEKIPCTLLITKCDELTGFEAYFSEATQDELIQTWGISFSKNNTDYESNFKKQFNALIKKINEQLIYRLHQERNAMQRPLIKDFPLQMEKLKNLTFEFIKKIHADIPEFFLKDIYFVSSLQKKSVKNIIRHEDIIQPHEHAVQLFEHPQNVSKTYFLKKLLTDVLGNVQIDHTLSKRKLKPTQVFAITVAILFVLGGIFFLVHDFRKSVKETYLVKQELSAYQFAVERFENADEHLVRTIHLMTSLEKISSNQNTPFNFLYVYSNQSQRKAHTLYQNLASMTLMAEIQHYLTDYLKIPVNREIESLYASLKIYLMLNNSEHRDKNYIYNILPKLLPSTISESEKKQLVHHIAYSFTLENKNRAIDEQLVSRAREYFTALPPNKLSYILLNNKVDNKLYENIDLQLNDNPIFKANSASSIPKMYTADAFKSIYLQDIPLIANESINGNWVLGFKANPSINQDEINVLVNQLRQDYLTLYVQKWEYFLSHLKMISPDNLTETSNLIENIYADNSALINLLSLVKENTYFEPVYSTSVPLAQLGKALDTNNENYLLPKIIIALKKLHDYISPAIYPEPSDEIAFELLKRRVQNNATNDAMMELRLLATQSPEPLQSWLEKIANDASHFLTVSANRYLDTAWNKDVYTPYKNTIANRYPFDYAADNEVSVKDFNEFFSINGVLNQFYQKNLSSLIDTSHDTWHWKTINNEKPMFPDETVRHIQHAMRIQKNFFAQNDKAILQFTLLPQSFSENIKSVQINVNDNQFIDHSNAKLNSHSFTWPSNQNDSQTTIQFNLNNASVIKKQFAGNWGWLKLIQASLDSARSQKQILLKLSIDDHSAKYLLSSKGESIPLLSLNLNHFKLSPYITQE